MMSILYVTVNQARIIEIVLVYEILLLSIMLKTLHLLSFKNLHAADLCT